MKKYSVTGIITISVSTDVDARNPVEAKRLAAERGVISLCHQCARGNPDEEWTTSGELDGEVQELEVEDETN